MADPSIFQSGVLALLAALVGGYLLGSIPFGLLLTRMAGLGDVRAIGSGNIGATNVLRTGNRKLAGATFLLDALKGTAAVLIAGRFGLDLALLAGFGAFVGHLFPVWIGFRGGKGVSTFVGVLLGLAPLYVLVFAAVWLGTAYTTRYSSLSALLATLATTIVLLIANHPGVGSLFAVITAISYGKHAGNIKRLMAGTESKIGAKG